MPTYIESVLNGIRRVFGLRPSTPVPAAPTQDEVRIALPSSAALEIEALSNVCTDHESGQPHDYEADLAMDMDVEANNQHYEDHFPPRLEPSETPFIALISSEEDILKHVENEDFARLIAANTWHEYDQLPSRLRCMGKFYDDVWADLSSGFRIARTPGEGDFTYVAKRYDDAELPFTVRTTQGWGTINDDSDFIHGDFRTLGDAMQAAVLIHNNPKTPQVFVYNLADDAREEQTVAHNTIVNKLPKMMDWRQPDPDPIP